uniref:Uncharacterized protein n=1 Tax=Nelumbo nucifera TaxID=4432 RepID=A0A822XJ06_NELNU|nr:TPA_asm: hypothetical protein HUJ06_020584 [Nelumbo nucifera]
MKRRTLVGFTTNPFDDDYEPDSETESNNFGEDMKEKEEVENLLSAVAELFVVEQNEITSISKFSNNGGILREVEYTLVGKGENCIMERGTPSQNLNSGQGTCKMIIVNLQTSDKGITRGDKR